MKRFDAIKRASDLTVPCKAAYKLKSQMTGPCGSASKDPLIIRQAEAMPTTSVKWTVIEHFMAFFPPEFEHGQDTYIMCHSEEREHQFLPELGVATTAKLWPSSHGYVEEGCQISPQVCMTLA